MEPTVLIVIVLLLGIAVALAIRAAVLWYFRINVLIELLTEIRNRLPTDGRSFIREGFRLGPVPPPSAGDRAFLAEAATRPLPRQE